ncbi:MAG: hypothetical protein ACLQMO_13120 [Acidobacteriaceae bacterium]
MKIALTSGTLSQLLSLMNHKSGILVIVHSFLRRLLLLITISFSDPVRMDNLVKLHI